MGFGLILAGMVFFCNPLVNLVDVLPDVFGWLLIALGLRKLADLDDRFFTARRLAHAMLPVTALKALLSVLLLMKWRDGLMPFTFLFAVIESLAAIFFFVNFYGGVEYMANLHGGDRHLRKVSETSLTAVVFSLIKNILAFVPESFALFTHEDELYLAADYRNHRVETLKMIKPYAVVLCTVVALIAGIVFLVRTVEYLKGIRKDTVFVGNLKELYRQKVYGDTALLDHRRFFRFFVLAFVGLAFLFDLTIDAVNLLPDTIGYACLFVACLVIGGERQSQNLPGNKRKLTMLFVPLVILSVISYAFRVITTFGVNSVMAYESYAVGRQAIVESGSAVPMGLVLMFAENLLFILFFRRVLLLIRDEYAFSAPAASDYTVPVRGPVILASLAGLLAAVEAVMPCITAYLQNKYLSDSLIYAAYEGYAQTSVGIHTVIGYLMLLFTALLIVSFIRIRKSIAFYL